MSKEMLGRIKQLSEQNDILQKLTKELAKLGLVRSKELRSLQADNKALREALEEVREVLGEYDEIHDCTGKSCCICRINKALSPTQTDIDNIIKDVNGDK